MATYSMYSRDISVLEKKLQYSFDVCHNMLSLYHHCQSISFLIVFLPRANIMFFHHNYMRCCQWHPCQGEHSHALLTNSGTVFAIGMCLSIHDYAVILLKLSVCCYILHGCRHHGCIAVPFIRCVCA